MIITIQYVQNLNCQSCCCCLPTPLTLVFFFGGGVRSSRFWSTSQLTWPATPVGSGHKSRCDSGVRMWVPLKRWCVWVLQMEHRGDGSDLASTLCKYDLRKVDLFVLSWARVRRGSIFLWWRCAQYFVIASCG